MPEMWKHEACGAVVPGGKSLYEHQDRCPSMNSRGAMRGGPGYGFTEVNMRPSNKAGAGARVSWDHGSMGEQHGTVWSEAPHMPLPGSGGKAIPFRHVIPDNSALIPPGAGHSIPLPLRDLTEHMGGVAASRQGEFHVARVPAT